MELRLPYPRTVDHEIEFFFSHMHLHISAIVLVGSLYSSRLADGIYLVCIDRLQHTSRMFEWLCYARKGAEPDEQAQFTCA